MTTATRRPRRISPTTALLTLSLVLGGCAAQQAFREGNRLVDQGREEAGLSRLADAVRLEPSNPTYRMVLANRRSQAVRGLVAQAERARRDGRFEDARTAYTRVLTVEPANSLALQGLREMGEEQRRASAVSEARTLADAADAGSHERALSIVQGVLKEDPENRRALALRDELMSKLPAQDVGDQRLGAAFRRPITLRFTETPIRQLFDFISQASGLNFVFDAEVKGDQRTTIAVKDTSIEDALHLVLATGQLEMRVLNPSTVLIFPATPQKERDYQALVLRTFYVTNADVKAVATSLKTIAKIRELIVDERLGLIMARDTPQAIRLAERMVALQDQADPEVMLEMEVLEVQRSRLTELGVQWPGQVTLAPLVTSGQGLTLWQFLHLSDQNTQVGVSALAINANGQDQDANILANPRIRVRNREKAKVLVGDRLPVITTTSTSTGFVSESVSYLDVGLKLEVEPTIYVGNDVAIKVNLEVSNITGQTISKAGTVSYQLGTRNASTVLRLHDGETQILAGLISDADRSSALKVPGLGDVPIAGRLFGSQKDDSSRNEILLSITPHVVRSLRRPGPDEQQFESGTEAAPGLGGLKLMQVDPATIKSGSGS